MSELQALMMLSLKHNGHVNYNVARKEYRNMNLRDRLGVARLTEMPTIYAGSLIITDDASCDSDVFRAKHVVDTIGIDFADPKGAIGSVRSALEHYDISVLHTNFPDALVLRNLDDSVGHIDYVDHDDSPAGWQACAERSLLPPFYFDLQPHIGVSVVTPQREVPALDEMYNQLKKVLALYGNERDTLSLIDELSRRIVALRLKSSIAVPGEPHMYNVNSAINEARDVVGKVDTIIDKLSTFCQTTLPAFVLNIISFIIDLYGLMVEFSYTRASSLFLRLLTFIKCKSAENVLQTYWNKLVSVLLPQKLVTVDTNNSGKSARVSGEPHINLPQGLQKQLPQLIPAVLVAGLAPQLIYDDSWQLRLMESIAAIVGVFIGFAALDFLTVERVLSFMRGISIVGNAVKSVPTIFEACLRFVPDAIKGWASIIAPEYTWSQSEEGVAYQKWLADVNEMTTDTRIITIMRNSDDQRKVEELALLAHNFFQKFSDANKLNSIVAGTFREAFGKIIRLAQQVYEARGLGPRTEPWHATIVGPPGHGKSHLANACANVLSPSHDIMGVAIPENMRVYAYTPNSTFMDGYMQQPVLLMDDIHQLTSGEDAIELIRFVGTTSLVCNMATLDNPAIGVKGTRFTSSVIVSTSNVMYPSPKTVVSAQAVRRRRHLLIETHAKPEYLQDGKLNLDTLSPEEIAEFAYLQCRTRDPLDPSGPVGEWVSAVEMIKTMVIANEKHQKNEIVFRDTGFKHLRERVLGEPHMLRGMFSNKKQETCPMRDMLDEMGVTIAENILKGGASSMSPEEFVHIHAQKHDQFMLKNDDEIELWNRCCQELQLSSVKIMSSNERLNELIATAKQKLDAYPILTWAFASLGLLSVIGTLLWAFMSREHEEPHMANPSAGETNKTARKVGAYKHNYTVLGKPHSGESVVPAPVPIAGSNDAFIALVRRNIVGLEYAPGGSVYAMGFSKNLIFTVAHFFHQFVGGERFYVIRMNKRISISYDPRRLRIYKRGNSHRDLAVYALPYDVIPLFRDISTHIVTPHEVDSIYVTNGAMVGPDVLYALPRIQRTLRTYEHLDGIFAVEDGFESPGFRGERGQCGLPYVGNFSQNWNENSVTKIIGLHAGAYGTEGYAEALTTLEYEDALEVMADFLAPFQSHVVASEAHCTLGGFEKSRWLHDDVDDKQIWPEGVLPTAVRMPTKHRFAPSPLCGAIYEPVTDNSVLSPFDQRLLPEELGKSPLLKAHAKVAKGKIDFPTNYLSDFVLNRAEFFREQSKTRIMRVLTWDEAINGHPGDPFIERLNMSTSAGMCYSTPGSRGKKHLFVEDTKDHYVPTDAFQEVLDTFWARLMQGEPIQHIWKATLKTERRKFEKIRLGKTRQFNIAQVVRILASRRLNLAFNALFLATRFKHEGAAGLNCFSPEWDILARKLLKMGERVFDLDYENFDGSTAPQILFLHPRIANEVYCDEACFRNARLALTHELAFRYEAVGDVVYQIYGGNPSGDDNTTIRNTLAGAFYLYLAWMHLAPEKFRTITDYYHNVAAAIVGDDNVVSVSETASVFYTPERICQCLASYNLVVTSASGADGVVGKQKDAAQFKNIKNCVFLKCRFAMCKDVDVVRTIPQMDPDTIHELTNWISIGLAPEEACLENCNTALRMMFFYGRDFFNILRSDIKTAWDARCLSPCELLTYDYLLHQWRTEQFQAFPQTSPAPDAPIVLE
jgi:hypothetical protein